MLAEFVSPMERLAMDVRTDRMVAIPTVEATISQFTPPIVAVVPMAAIAVCAAVLIALSIMYLINFFIMNFLS